MNSPGILGSGETGLGSGNVMNSPGMQSLMQQMAENPTLMSQMMSAPYMQSIFSSLQNNPDAGSLCWESTTATTDECHDAEPAATDAEPISATAHVQPRGPAGYHANSTRHGSTKNGCA